MKTSKTGPRLKKPGGEGLLRASPFLLPSLIGLAIFYLAPMVVSIFISLTDWNGLDRLFADGFMQEHFIGLDNYKAILTSQEFWKVLKNTLTYIVLYLPLMMAVSLAVASLLSQQRRGVGPDLLGRGIVDLEKHSGPAVRCYEQHPCFLWN